MKIFILNILLLFTACEYQCPPCPEYPECKPVVVVLRDSLNTAAWTQYAEHIWDSVKAVRYVQIDSFFELRNAQIDSMKFAAIFEIQEQRAELNNEIASFDSLRHIKFKDNMFIMHQPGMKAIAGFDSITKKPFLKME